MSPRQRLHRDNKLLPNRKPLGQADRLTGIQPPGNVGISLRRSVTRGRICIPPSSSPILLSLSCSLSFSPPMPAAWIPADENTDFAQICDPGHILAFSSAICGPYHCTRRPTFVGPELTLPHPLPFFGRCINRSRLRATSFIWLDARTARDTGLSTIISLPLKSWPIFAGWRSGTRAPLTSEVNISVDLKWLG